MKRINQFWAFALNIILDFIQLIPVMGAILLLYFFLEWADALVFGDYLK